MLLNAPMYPMNIRFSNVLRRETSFSYKARRTGGASISRKPLHRFPRPERKCARNTHGAHNVLLPGYKNSFFLFEYTTSNFENNDIALSARCNARKPEKNLKKKIKQSRITLVRREKNFTVDVTITSYFSNVRYHPSFSAKPITFLRKFA